MTKELSSRQVCFIMAAYSSVLKLLLYPAFAASAAGADIIFPAAFNLILQSVAVWSVSYACSKAEAPLFSLVAKRCGVGLSRALAALFALYFLLSTVVPLHEQQLLVHDAFYDTVASLNLFLPIFFFTVYAGAKSLKCAGRCADICFPVFAFCICLFLIMSAGQANYSNLLPVLRTPFKRLAGATLFSAFRFSDSALMLMFMGRFKYNKGDAAKITLSYIGGGAITIALIAVYYGVYGALSPTRSFLLNSVCAFFPAINFLGRADLVAVYALDIVVLFAIALNIKLSVLCLEELFSRKNSAAFSLAANLVLFILVIILNNKFVAVQNFAARWLWISCLIFSYLAPALVHVFARRSHARK